MTSYRDAQLHLGKHCSRQSNKIPNASKLNFNELTEKKAIKPIKKFMYFSLHETWPELPENVNHGFFLGFDLGQVTKLVRQKQK